MLTSPEPAFDDELKAAGKTARDAWVPLLRAGCGLIDRGLCEYFDMQIANGNEEYLCLDVLLILADVCRHRKGVNLTLQDIARCDSAIQNHGDDCALFARSCIRSSR